MFNLHFLYVIFLKILCNVHHHTFFYFSLNNLNIYVLLLITFLDFLLYLLKLNYDYLLMHLLKLHCIFHLNDNYINLIIKVYHFFLMLHIMPLFHYNHKYFYLYHMLLNYLILNQLLLLIYLFLIILLLLPMFLVLNYFLLIQVSYLILYLPF